MVYLDDVTMLSEQRSDHIRHLKNIFERCRKYGISLNPKKSIFAVSEGNILGHVIAKSCIKVNPDRVGTVTQIPFPMNKKAMLSFLGKINFLRKYIFDYAQIVKQIHEMVKNDTVYKWDKGKRMCFPVLNRLQQKHPHCTNWTLINISYSTLFLLIPLLLLYSLERMNWTMSVLSPSWSQVYKDQILTTPPPTNRIMKYTRR